MAYLHRALRLLPVALALAALALAILSQASVFHVQDDAYMYARYAHNLSAGDGLAWDPGGEPTYGATSLFYVPWVAFIARILPDDPGRTIVIASVSSMLLALALMGLLVRRSLPAKAASPGLVGVLCLVVVAMAHPALAAHATNGMDTGLAMACVALLLLAWWRHVGASSAQEPAPKRIWIVLASGLAFGVRPDLGLYAIGIPLVMCVLAPRERRLSHAVTALASAAAVVLLLGFAWWYFGTPLTLSFYAKALHNSYGAEFVRSHAPVAGQQFILFLLFFAPLWIAALIDLPARWRARHAPEHALWIGILAATLLHWMYYRFAVMQVVGSWQRFYYPSLPALLFLGATSGARLLESWQLTDQESPLGRRFMNSAFALCAVASALTLALPFGWMLRVLPERLKPYREEFISAIDMLRGEIDSGQLLKFDMHDRYANTKARSFWFALDEFSKLPDDVAIATTEVGLPAALNPRKRIIDLAGLNENGFARNGFDARRLCEDLRPDVLYLPHRDYTTLIAALLNAQSFQREYELFPKTDLHAFMDLALRRKSPHYAEMRAIVAARLAESASGTTGQNH